MVALKVSAYSREIVKQARKEKGWKIDDFRWLEEASKVLGISWQEAGYFADGISEGTWKRFLSGKYAVNVNAFRAFCQVLGLQWQEIIERNNYQDWGEDIDVASFVGRLTELDILQQHIIQDKCRLVTLLGMGGIGKTALSVKIAQLIENKFEFIIWRSLRHSPPVEKILADLIQFLSKNKQIDLPNSLEQKILLLLKYLRHSRCLLLLDNVESILQSGHDRFCSSLSVKYRSGYENYGHLFKAIADTKHQSCLILTSREQPPELLSLEGDNLPVRCLKLQGLSNVAGQQLLGLKNNLSNVTTAYQTLVNYYGGNPFALKVVSATIQEYFEGNVANFITAFQKNTLIFDEIHDLLKQQFTRLTSFEQQIMYWLAIHRDPVSIQNLQQYFITPVSSLQLLQSLASLQKRSLIEKTGNCFGLQKIVMEYVLQNSITQAD